MSAIVQCRATEAPQTVAHDLLLSERGSRLAAVTLTSRLRHKGVLSAVAGERFCERNSRVGAAVERARRRARVGDASTPVCQVDASAADGSGTDMPVAYAVRTRSPSRAPPHARTPSSWVRSRVWSSASRGPRRTGYGAGAGSSDRSAPGSRAIARRARSRAVSIGVFVPTSELGFRDGWPSVRLICAYVEDPWPERLRAPHPVVAWSDHGGRAIHGSWLLSAWCSSDAAPSSVRRSALHRRRVLRESRASRAVRRGFRLIGG